MTDEILKKVLEGRMELMKKQKIAMIQQKLSKIETKKQLRIFFGEEGKNQKL